MKNKLWIIMMLLIISCTKNNKQIETNKVENIDIIEDVKSVDRETPNKWDNFDWLTEFDWSLEDGRYYFDSTAEHLDLIGDMAPFVKIYKFNFPSDAELYQVRLRNEHFYFIYTIGKDNKRYPLENTFFNKILDYEFRDNFSTLALYMDNGYSYTIQDRVGEQICSDYPLIGTWGKPPSITEYHLLDPVDCVYYMEINKKFPKFAIREGTYLLKQIGERSFETISSFSDGQLRLEFINDRSMLITPLFTITDGEEGIVGPLIMSYNPWVPRFIPEE